MPRAATALKTKPEATGKSYATLVREGKVAMQNIEQSQWILGDLALEVEPIKKGERRYRRNEKLSKFADEIGCPYDSLREYREVAARWPVAERSASTSFGAHKILKTAKDRAKRIKPGMTCKEAREALREFEQERSEETHLRAARKKRREETEQREGQRHKEFEAQERAILLERENSPDGKAARQATALLRQALDQYGASEADAFFKKALKLISAHTRLRVQVVVEEEEW
jgi:hypothetical protein